MLPIGFACLRANFNLNMLPVPAIGTAAQAYCPELFLPLYILQNSTGCAVNCTNYIVRVSGSLNFSVTLSPYNPLPVGKRSKTTLFANVYPPAGDGDGGSLPVSLPWVQW